jgi:hypothetical protein
MWTGIKSHFKLPSAELCQAKLQDYFASMNSKPNILGLIYNAPEGRKNMWEGADLRLLEDAKNDLRELQVERWREQGDNKEWTSVLKEAEVCREH